jgi:hypothetical protein
MNAATFYKCVDHSDPRYTTTLRYIRRFVGARFVPHVLSDLRCQAVMPQEVRDLVCKTFIEKEVNSHG